MFDHVSKHLRVSKHAARRIFNSLLSVWKCGQTRSFVFDILHGCITKTIKLILKMHKLHIQTSKSSSKYSAARRIFNSLLSVWKCGQTRSSVFDILHGCITKTTKLILKMHKLHIQTPKSSSKYSAARRIFNSLLSVWKCGQTRSFVFDILHGSITKTIKLILKMHKLHIQTPKSSSKYSAARRIFNSLLSVWKCGQTRSFVFDILHGSITKTIKLILKMHKLHTAIYFLRTKN